jgi:CBS domain-containing protein
LHGTVNMNKDITVKPDITIRKAMKALDRTVGKCLLIFYENKKLFWTLMDGNRRRSILDGVQFLEDISGCYNKCPITIAKNQYNTEEAKQFLLENKLDLIPVIDDEGIVMEYVI